MKLLLISALILLGTVSDASAGVWLTGRLGYASSYSYPRSGGQEILGGPHSGALTLALGGVPSDIRRWAVGCVVSYWLFHGSSPSSIGGADFVRTTHFVGLTPGLRFTLGDLQTRKRPYLEGGPLVGWVGMSMSQDYSSESSGDGFDLWDSTWVLGARLAGAVPLVAFDSSQLELGLEYVHTLDLSLGDAPFYDMQGFRQLGIFAGYAW